MRLNWLLLFLAARPGRQARHPLADPLERPEWKGKDRTIRLLCWLARFL